MRIIGVAPDFMQRLKFYTHQQIATGHSSGNRCYRALPKNGLLPQEIWAKCFKYRHSEATHSTKGKRKEY